MNPSKLSERAKEIALEMGAEAVVVIMLVPNKSGDGWDAEHSGYIQRDTGLDWGLVGKVVADASEDIVTETVIADPEPS